MTLSSHAVIRTASILVIGDEVLNSKIRDLNSHTFARFCFARGIKLKAISVVGDEILEIATALNHMARHYDLVVTSGGIGPTHDDITYEALAKAFNLPLALNREVIERMNRLQKPKTSCLNPEQQAAQNRMATFPAGLEVKNLFPDDTLWVPVVSVRNQVHVFPGVPQLFDRLLHGLGGLLAPRLPDLSTQKYLRYYVKTSMSESRLAPYLSHTQALWNERLATEEEDDRIKLGSYPHMGFKVNTISVIGLGRFKNELREVVQGVVENLEGVEISLEEEELLSQDLSQNKG